MDKPNETPQINSEKMKDFVEFFNENLAPIIRNNKEHFDKIIKTRRAEIAQRKERQRQKESE